MRSWASSRGARACRPMRLFPLLLLLPAARVSASLSSAALSPLRVGSVTPKRWLLRQLVLQAEGLGGHLAHFWPDVAHSVWLGGTADGGLHERTPYWLNGIVPLAFLLRNAGVHTLGPLAGVWKAPEGAKGWLPGPLCQPGADARGGDLADARGYVVGNASQCREDCAHRHGCTRFIVSLCAASGGEIVQGGVEPLMPTGAQAGVRCWLKDSQAKVVSAPRRNDERPTGMGDDCRCLGTLPPKFRKVDVMAQAKEYINYILLHQAPSGWLGPDFSSGKGTGVEYWGPSNVLLALTSFAEGTTTTGQTDLSKNATVAILRHVLEMRRRLPSTPLTSWAKTRWMDLAWTIEWLFDHAPELSAPHAEELLNTLHMLHAQGFDREEWFEQMSPLGAQGDRHNVNVAQGLKSSAVLWRFNSSFTHNGLSLPELSLRRMARLDKEVGLPTGMYNGDELLPNPATRSPSRGIELCGVVEAMWSYMVLFATHGFPTFAERAETIAYNALPATWASPTGGDMWAHQYLQAVNEISAIPSSPHVWQHDGPFAETYGLEPNYGCCTANFQQGWPKFASNLFFTSSDGAIVVAAWAPASAKADLPLGGQSSLSILIDVDTDYPFGDTADVRVTVTPSKNDSRDRFPVPVRLRIPSWAKSARVNGAPVIAGRFWEGVASVGGTTAFSVSFRPTVRLEHWDGGAVSVHRGALLFALPLKPEYRTTAHHFGTSTMSNDYEITTKQPWAYALDVNPAEVESSISVTIHEYVTGSAPFNHSDWPLALGAPLRPLISWVRDWRFNESAAPPPQSPACRERGVGRLSLPEGRLSSVCGPTELHELVPYGGTELRIGELPLAFYPQLAANDPPLVVSPR